MSRPINNAYAAALDFFENLKIPNSPLGVLNIEFAENFLKRLFRLRRVALGRADPEQAGSSNKDCGQYAMPIHAEGRSAVPSAGELKRERRSSDSGKLKSLRMPGSPTPPRCFLRKSQSRVLKKIPSLTRKMTALRRNAKPTKMTNPNDEPRRNDE
jgi:hypothetical protein